MAMSSVTAKGGDALMEIIHLLLAGGRNLPLSVIRQGKKIAAATKDQLRDPAAGWKLLDAKSEAAWQVATFDPVENLEPVVMERFRPVTPPKHFENWFAPDYAAVADQWTTVSASLSISAPEEYRNQPFWKNQPKHNGEVILMRKTVQIDDLDQSLFRLVAYTRQGFRIYVNGQLVCESKSRSKNWFPRIEYGDAKPTASSAKPSSPAPTSSLPPASANTSKARRVISKSISKASNNFQNRIDSTPVMSRLTSMPITFAAFSSAGGLAQNM